MRLLVTGIGSMWGSQVARALEAEPSIEVVVGLDTDDPKVQLERTEFVRSDRTYSIVQRIAQATHVDTILHLHLATDTVEHGGRDMHDRNVIGTANVAAAASNGIVRKLVVRGSTQIYGSNPDDPYWFREDALRRQPPRDRVESSLLEADDLVREVAEEDRRVQVTRLRFADVLGGDIDSSFSRVLRLPLVPEVFGFDPRLQLVHETDAVAAVVHATLNQVPGVYNVAGDGVLPWSEVCAITGRRRVPLPPVLTKLAAETLRRLRIAPLPDEMLRVLRYGRAVDSSAYRRAGFRFTHTTRSTVDDFAEWLRLRAAVREPSPAYTYEHETESFLRRSQAVMRD